MCGWIKLHRSISGCAIANHPEYFAVWVHLLLKAQHKATTAVVGRATVVLNPGQLVFGRIKFSAEVGVSESKVRAALDVLKSLDMITIKNNAKFSIISITKWFDYQESSPADDQQMTSKSPASDQQVTTYKNVKNVNNEKEVKPTGKPLVTFSSWIKSVKDAGENPIAEDDPIFDYALDAGIDIQFLRMAWVQFRDRYLSEDKKYKDWRAVYRKAIKENWLKLWWHDGEGYKLTSVGLQAMTAMNNRDKREGGE